MKRNKGFTLVELLVVVAIITILASIVTPNVLDWISRARVAKAISEVKSAELALTKMLTDAGKESFGHFFTGVSFGSVVEAEDFYTEAFYILLRQGREAQIPELKTSVRDRLGKAYMDLGKDPWGQLYRFYAPIHRTDNIYFRIYRPSFDVPPPPVEDDCTLATPELGNYGYAAPRNLPVYVYSMGSDEACAQAIYRNPNGSVSGELAYRLNRDDLDIEGNYINNVADYEHAGGGDDINNWDNAQSWAGFY